MPEESKETWNLLSKIAGAGGLALIVRELLRIFWSPKQKTDELEEKYSEIFLGRIRQLEADMENIRQKYDERLQGYSIKYHHQIRLVMKYRAQLYVMGHQTDPNDDLIPDYQPTPLPPIQKKGASEQ